MSRETRAARSKDDACTGSAVRRGEPPLEELLAGRFRALLADLHEAGCRGVYEHVLESVERPLVREALAVTGGNQVRAARLLGLGRNTLRRKIERLGIKARG